ncbi:hypothetical protein B296_00051935 [Ensete ventricosum]|uniref:Uncharacterized protein n=1 Tax=Ensete ventricosum TaxID=4639 RepID=A0A426Y9J7_ENSVE|nr:hypothetical protein B296_00051935 [Ensete ventricosum]
MAAAASGTASPSNLRLPSSLSSRLPSHPFPQIATVRFLSPVLPPQCLRISARRPLTVRSGRGGSVGGGDGGGSGGGGGDGGEDGDSGQKNRSEVLLVLAEAGRTLESLPKDLAASIESGRIPGSIVRRFFDLEKSPVFRWLLQFGGFKERLLADDLFLAKVTMECGVGIFTKVLLLFNVYRSVRVVCTSPPADRYADRPLPGGTADWDCFRPVLTRN